MAGLIENIANSAQLRMGLGLSLAKKDFFARIMHWKLKHQNSKIKQQHSKNVVYNVLYVFYLHTIMQNSFKTSISITVM